MLSDATLSRVSASYRRGYRDAEAGQPPRNNPIPTTDSGIPTKPFSDFDYKEGWEAGANDLYWSLVHSGRLSRGTERNEWIASRRAGL